LRTVLLIIIHRPQKPFIPQKNCSSPKSETQRVIQYRLAEEYCLGTSKTGHTKEWFSEPGLLLKTILIAKKPFILINGSPNQPFIP
jgi:hypothetical protein